MMIVESVCSADKLKFGRKGNAVSVNFKHSIIMYYRGANLAPKMDDQVILTSKIVALELDQH